MSIARQITHTNLIPAIRNEVGYFPFEGIIETDYRYKSWNVTMEWVPEFYGSAFDLALSGRVRSNFRGYRLKASLQLDNSTQSENIRLLFNKLSAGYDRLFYDLVTNGAGSGSSTLIFTSDAPVDNDYLNGLVISGLTTGDVVVTDYNGNSRTATLSATRSWATALAVTAKAQPNLSTYILFGIAGTASSFTNADLIPCVVTNNNYGISRQATIQQQRISIEMESVELYQNIPDSFVIE